MQKKNKTNVLLSLSLPHHEFVEIDCNRDKNQWFASMEIHQSGFAIPTKSKRTIEFCVH